MVSQAEGRALHHQRAWWQWWRNVQFLYLLTCIESVCGKQQELTLEKEVGGTYREELALPGSRRNVDTWAVGTDSHSELWEQKSESGATTLIADYHTVGGNALLPEHPASSGT